jgi:hypothetical protein
MVNDVLTAIPFSTNAEVSDYHEDPQNWLTGQSDIIAEILPL